MRRWTVLLLLAGCCLGPLLVGAAAQEDSAPPPRKVLNRVVPSYPELARTMNLRGTVRVDAVVAPNGVVKSAKIVGGHPVLAQAAVNAVYKWKWATATKESHEPVEVRFDPQ